MNRKCRLSTLCRMGISTIVLSLTGFTVQAEDQCESVLRYAGMDESIVSNEVQRLDKFVNEFCSSSDSAQNAYLNASQGLDVGFKGFSVDMSSDSNSSQLSQIKSSMCSNQQKTKNDLEKYHREDRHASRESITAWESCMHRTGLAARATINEKKTVIITIAYRPNSTGDTAQVFKPYDTESSNHCEYIGNPALASQDSFVVGPAAVNFVCRRTKPTDAMTIVLSANTAFVNGTNPVIKVAPYNPRIEISAPLPSAVPAPSRGRRCNRGGDCPPPVGGGQSTPPTGGGAPVPGGFPP